MSLAILSLLERKDMTALEIRTALDMRHERVYQHLVHLEAAGMVAPRVKQSTATAPRVAVWQRTA